MPNGGEGVAADGGPNPDSTAAGHTTPVAAQEADTQQTGTGKRKRTLVKSKRKSAAGTAGSNGAKSATGRKAKVAKQTKT